MTIDEAIAKYNKLANNDRTCHPEEAQQLAEWLEELKDHRERECNHINEVLYEKGYSCGYNKAIDDFVDKAIKIVYEANNRDRNPQPRDMVADIHYKFIELAERLKAGGKE